MRKARDEAAADRIGNVRENDGDGARLLQHRRSGGCVCRKNEIGLQCDEFFRKSLYRLHVGRRPTGVDPEVAALCPPELLKFLPERGDEGLSLPVALGMAGVGGEAERIPTRACRTVETG